MILRRALVRQSRSALLIRSTWLQTQPLHQYLGTSRPFTTLQSEAVNGEGERDFEVELEESMVGVSKRSSPVIEVKEKLPSRSREYEHFKEFKKTTGRLGAKIAPHYRPHRIVNKPLTPHDITLELLLASGAHLGHATSLWNPGNQRYIFGIRQGVHIISLEQTAAHLRRAAKVVEGVTRNGGLVLFVGSRPGQGRSVIEAAKMSGGCHLFEKWTPGTITNGTRIVGHGKVVEKDLADRVNPIGPIEGQGPLRPDLVVCLNPLENYVLLHECGLYGIPTIGIIDTDADPTGVTYPIPANDDSLRCVQLIVGVLGRAGESGRITRIRNVNLEETSVHVMQQIS